MDGLCSRDSGARDILDSVRRIWIELEFNFVWTHTVIYMMILTYLTYLEMTHARYVRLLVDSRLIRKFDFWKLVEAAMPALLPQE